MSKRRLPVIFLLQFSKSLDHPTKQHVRFLVYFCFVFSVFAGTLLEVNLAVAEGVSDLILPATLSNLLTLFFLHLARSSFDSILMIRKDWEHALSALEYWGEVKKDGKLRFVFKQFIGEIILASLWLYLNARYVFWSESRVSTLAIGGLVILGILLTIRLIIWQLNVKYEDKIEAQLWQVRGSSEENESILSHNT